VDKQVDIILPGGILIVCWDGVGEVSLAGPVETVFEGEWHNENLLREEIWK
jgi:diaminopimelate epimerase